MIRLSAVGCSLTADFGLQSRKQEGSGAFGVRVLSFVRFAPNDGFRPQSGLVQREFYMPPTGGYILIARQGDTTPSEPFEPSEPSEPSRPKGVSMNPGRSAAPYSILFILAFII